MAYDVSRNLNEIYTHSKHYSKTYYRTKCVQIIYETLIIYFLNVLYCTYNFKVHICPAE